MNKIDLIKKEVKDCKLYLNELYASLKKETSEKEIKNLNNEIKAVSYTKNRLLEIVAAYDEGNGDSKLKEVTKETDAVLERFQFFEGNCTDLEFEMFWNANSLKDSLDIINDNYLSKEEIYEYLNDYNEVMRLARKNIEVPIGQIFFAYMNSTNQPHKASSLYYQKMIKMHIWFVNASILAVTKDEEFEHLWANDMEMGEKTKDGGLAFLKDRFVIPTDFSRFKKTHIFNFVRNAFFHSDNNELYKIYPGCNFMRVTLKQTNPIPFDIKLMAGDVFRMCRFVQDYSHHASVFELENQDKINVDMLVSHYHKCSRELDKVSLVRKLLPVGINDRKEDIHHVLNTVAVNEDSATFNNILAKYGNVTDIKYQFSEGQKRLYHNKFKYFNKYFGYMGMNHFVVPIISNYMACGINKIHFIYLDSVIAYTYLFNMNNSVEDIMSDICSDYNEIVNMGKVTSDKSSIFEFISNDFNQSKHHLLYVFDHDERENFNDILLFKYVYGTVCCDEKVSIGGIEYSVEHIRNAFTHNRWRGFVNQDGKRCFYLYDDEDLLVDPEKAYWSATVLYDDLRETMGSIMKDYGKGNQQGISKVLSK